MKPEVTLKYLAYLRNKKQQDEGFTLIELLVVVIIIGVLAAVALPNLLSQVGKARETELKNAAGTTVRSEQAYHFERQTFTGVVANLGVQFPTQYLTNASGLITAFGATSANVQPQNSDAANDGTRAYSSRIIYAAGEYDQIMCQSNEVTNVVVSPTGAAIGSLVCSSAVSIEIQ